VFEADYGAFKKGKGATEIIGVDNEGMRFIVLFQNCLNFPFLIKEF